MKKLVHKKTKQSIVEFTTEYTIFYNTFLEKEMKSMGILIPHGMRGRYQGQDCIRLGDAGFQKAFQEIYYPSAMDPEQFQWLDA